jgi:ABC-type sugar transport system permease subunit
MGVALFGTVYASRLAHNLPIEIEKLRASNPAALVGATPEKFVALKENTAVLKTFTPELQVGIINAFVNSFHIVFLTAVPITVIGFFIAFMLRETPLRTGVGHQAAKEEAAGEALA